MEKTLNVGVLGAGYISEKFHIPILKSLKQVRLVSICDVNQERLYDIAKTFEIKKTYLSLAEMLANEKLDLVDVLTPPQTHASLCSQVLSSGVNCLVEKPITTSVQDADKLIELSERSKAKLYVIHNYSYVPAFAKARKMVENGEIGELLNIDGFYSMPHENGFLLEHHWVHGIPGDALGEVAPHFTMLLLEYLDEVTEIKAIVKKKGDYSTISYDEMKVILDSKKGMGSITVLLGPGGDTRRAYLNLTGTTASLYADGESQAVVKYKSLGEGWSATERGSRAISDIFQRARSFVSTALNIATGRYQMAIQGHKYLIEQCIDSILIGTPYPISLKRCREEVRVLEQVFHQSTSTGKVNQRA